MNIQNIKKISLCLFIVNGLIINIPIFGMSLQLARNLRNKSFFYLNRYRLFSKISKLKNDSVVKNTEKANNSSSKQLSNYFFKRLNYLTRNFKKENNRAIFEYTGSFDKIDGKNIHQTYEYQEFINCFNRLDPILKKEFINDLNEIGSFYLKNSFKKSKSINQILDQFPINLQSYFTNIIVDFSNKINGLGFNISCINIRTSYETDSNDNKIINKIKTVIVGQQGSSSLKNCCRNCKEELLLLEGKPEKILNITSDMDSDTIKKIYFEKLFKAEKENDVEMVKILKEAYQDLIGVPEKELVLVERETDIKELYFHIRMNAEKEKK